MTTGLKHLARDACQPPSNKCVRRVALSGRVSSNGSVYRPGHDPLAPVSHLSAHVEYRICHQIYELVCKILSFGEAQSLTKTATGQHGVPTFPVLVLNITLWPR